MVVSTAKIELLTQLESCYVVYKRGLIETPSLIGLSYDVPQHQISFFFVTCKVDSIIFDPTSTFCILHLVTDNEINSDLELTKNH